MKSQGIIAYGKQEDRDKLAALAKLSGQSGSEWIVSQIRKIYEESFGELDPKLIVTMS